MIFNYEQLLENDTNFLEFVLFVYENEQVIADINIPLEWKGFIDESYDEDGDVYYFLTNRAIELLIQEGFLDQAKKIGRGFKTDMKDIGNTARSLPGDLKNKARNLGASVKAAPKNLKNFGSMAKKNPKLGAFTAAKNIGHLGHKIAHSSAAKLYHGSHGIMH